MMDSALSMRAYTSEEIVPLLSAQMAKDFLPQSVPSYAATQNFLKLREHHPEYAYREATLNPTNLRDRATDWEADIVQQFRNDPHTPRDRRRARYPHGPLAVPGAARSRRARMPGVPQRARGGSGDAARALRQQQRLRLAAPRDRRRAGGLRTARRGHGQCRAASSATS